MAEPNNSSPPPTTTKQSTNDTQLQSWKLLTVIGSLCLGIFLLGLDMNIIGVAVPRITTDFRSLHDIAWYGSAYLLTITAFQPFFGNLYKYFNAKLMYLSSLVLFEGDNTSGYHAKQTLANIIKWDPSSAPRLQARLSSYSVAHSWGLVLPVFSRALWQ